jgi:hypothetical protein
MIKLKPIDATGYSKLQQWCVPSALSIITGAPLKETTEILTRISGRSYQELEGCWMEDAVLALNEYGFTAKPINIIDRFSDTTHGPTLTRFFSERQPHEVINPLLVAVNAHAIVTHYNYIFDNSTGGLPVTPDYFPKTHRLVKEAYIIERKA